MDFQIREEVIKALVDYKFLLNRGYPQKASLDFITSHYGLSRLERALLLRCIHSDRDVIEISNKIVTASDVSKYILVLDGFNVLLTTASAIEGDYVYLCDDGLVRDLRSSKPRELEEGILKESLNLLNEYLIMLKPINAVIVFDKNVSRSAEFKLVVQGMVRNVEVVLASKADITVISANTLISSSDFVILKRVNKVFDLAGYIIINEFKDRVIDITALIRDEIRKLKFNIS